MNTSKTFDDIGIIPRVKSQIKSRSKVSLHTSIKKAQLRIPLIASPMDTVCNADMAIAMNKAGGVGIIHRFQTIDDQVDNFRKVLELSGIHPTRTYEYPLANIGIAVGVNGDYKERLTSLIKTYNEYNLFDTFLWICFDTANGFSQYMEDALNWFRKESGLYDTDKHIIMAGNIASKEGYQFLSDLGVDCVRVGIGGGCFLPDMNVITSNGNVKISDIKNGDSVLTHKREYKTVTGNISYDYRDMIISINGIKSTLNHKYYVLHKKYKDIVSDDNIYQYAEFIEAKDITNEYFLLKME